MTEEPDDATEQLLFRCLEAERPEELLQQVGGSDPGLADRVRTLLGGLRARGLLADGGPGTEAVDAPGTALGRYRITGRLGQGGMGTVFRAHDEASGREVALKLVRPEFLLFPAARRRFETEIAAVSRLRHPGIVHVHEAGEAADRRFFTMELVDGEDLGSILSRLRRADRPLVGADFTAGGPSGADAASPPSPPVTPPPSPACWAVRSGSRDDAAAWIARQVAAALAHAHEHGILHRDVKPSNVMVDRFGHARLLDFGLARMDDTPHGTTPLGAATATGSVLGSIPYVAPEQLLGEAAKVDERADVYGVGVLLYEMLTLRAPFHDPQDTARTYANVVRGRPVRPRRLRAPIPRALEAICLRAMHRRPERRYADADALRADLDAWLAREPVTTVAVHRTRRLSWALAAAAVAALMVASSLRPRPGGTAVHARPLPSIRPTAYRIERALQHGRDDRARELLVDAAQAEGNALEWSLLEQRATHPPPSFSLAGGSLRVLGAGPGEGEIHGALDDRVVRVWNHQGEVLREFARSGTVGTVTSADGHVLAQVDRATRRLIECVDLRTMQTRTVQAPTRVECLALDGGGRRLAVATADGMVAVRGLDDADGGDLPAEASFRTWDAGGTASRWTSMGWSPDGGMLVLASSDGWLHAFDPGTGQRLWSDDLGGQGEFVAWTHDGWLAVAVQRGHVEVFDRQGHRLRTLRRAGSAPISALAIDREATSIWAGHDDGKVTIWHARTGDLARVLPSHGSGVQSIAFARDGTTCVVGTGEGRVWVRATAALRGFVDAATGVVDLAVSPDGTVVAVGTGPGRLVRPGARVAERVDAIPPAHAVVFLDPETVAVCDRENPGVVVVDVGEGRVLRRSPPEEPSGYDLIVLPDGHLAEACWDGAVRIRDPETASSVHDLEGHIFPVRRLARAPGGLVSTGDDRTVRRWWLPSGRQQVLATLTSAVFAVAVDEDTGTVFAGDSSGSVLALRLDDGQVLWRQEMDARTTGLALSEDRTRLVGTGTMHDGLSVWSSATGERLADTGRNRTAPYCLEALPEGRGFVAGDLDGWVRFWLLPPLPSGR